MLLQENQAEFVGVDVQNYTITLSQTGSKQLDHKLKSGTILIYVQCITPSIPTH